MPKQFDKDQMLRDQNWTDDEIKAFFTELRELAHDGKTVPDAIGDKVSNLAAAKSREVVK